MILMILCMRGSVVNVDGNLGMKTTHDLDYLIVEYEENLEADKQNVGAPATEKKNMGM